ncbi:MAG: tyrosine-type recombinase/integrase [Planctomycetota bacterium]
MANKPKMWQRGQTGGWYVTINGEQIPLGKDKEEAEAEYQRLLGAGGFADVQRADDILDLYLDWVGVNRAPSTFKDHRTLLRDFNGALPNAIRVCDLKPFHVSRWLDGHDTWGDTMKNRVAGVVKRAFNWAVEQGLITHSPIAQLKAPPKRSSDVFVSTDMWEEIQRIVKDEAFRDFVTILWETGCRPIEARTVERKHVQQDHWLFPKLDSKGQRYNRVVWLSDKALSVCLKQMEKYQTGPLFRNRNGEPWTKNALVCRFKRLSEKLGTRVNAKAFRHGFCTRALEKGEDSTTVSVLMGHRDTTMVARVYQHLTHNKKHLQAALQRVTSDDDAA